MADEKPRRPFPQFNAFRPWVTKELERRKNAYPVDVAAPFARMTSCMLEPNFHYKFFTLGLHGFDTNDMNMFEATYVGRDVVGYAVDTRSNINRLIAADELSVADLPKVLTDTFDKTQLDSIKGKIIENASETRKLTVLGAHPIPGLTSINVRRENLGAPMTVDIKWICYNRAQMEYVRNHFMLAGRYVVIEWGNQFPKTKLKTLDFRDPLILDELETCILHGRGHVINKWVELNNGNYDFVVGMVGNYKVNLDSSSGVYECSATVYTMGENMYGINLFNTIIKTNDPAQVSSTKSFKDFFQYGGKFDQTINSNSNDLENVVISSTQWIKQRENDAKTSKDFVKTAVNSHDYAFISWRFFTENIFDAMFSAFNDLNLKSEILKIISFSNGLNRFSQTSDPVDPDDQDWVGYNRFLRSIDIETMVLISSDTDTPIEMNVSSKIDSFSGCTIDGVKCRGKLTKGVWLNVEMIREAFIGNNNFQSAITDILSRMNRATAGYWDLRMFYDEETNTYKIIDGKHAKFPENLTEEFYHFNSGSLGECLSINLDSAFPPELVTQMALTAHFRSANVSASAKLLSELPTLGTTSLFMYSLNWTGMKDMLDERIYNKTKGGGSTSSGPTVMTPTPDNTTITEKVSYRAIGTTPNVIAPAVSTTVGGNSPKTNASTISTAPDTKPVIMIGDARSARNNNPGNFKVATAKQYADGKFGVEITPPGVTQGTSEKNAPPGTYAKFETSEAGLQAVYNYIDTKKAKNMTFRSFMLEYAPPFENSDIYDRLKSMCDTLQVTETTPLRARKTSTIAKKLVQQESSTRLVNIPYDNTDLLNTQLGGMTHVDTSTVSSVPDGKIYKPDPVSEDYVKSINAKKDEITTKFANSFLTVIPLDESSMTNAIVRSSFENLKVPNSFVVPFPTTTAVDVSIRGMSGISVSDGFYVDRLPFIFEKYGCFQVFRIQESITPDGWKTSVTGYFKLLTLTRE
jgi:hypothetical protein